MQALWLSGRLDSGGSKTDGRTAEEWRDLYYSESAVDRPDQSRF
jgi:hypothetical protein